MAKSLNKVMLIGNLGRDPEVRYTASSVAVATFSIATNESWHQYLHKGSKIYIEGRIQTRSYDDKNTGVKKYMTEIVASNMIMLDSKDAGSGAGNSSYTPPEASAGPAEGGKQESDLPF